MRIGYNLFLWHILGRIKPSRFRRKILSLKGIFPFTGPNLIFTLFHSSHTAFIQSPCSLHKKRKSGLALVGLGSSGADGKLQQMLHSSPPGEAPRAFPCGCVQEGKAQHHCLWFIRAAFCFSSYTEKCWS